MILTSQTAMRKFNLGSFVCLFLIGLIFTVAKAPFAFCADNWTDRGMSYVQARDYSKGLECFHASLKERPDNWQTLQNIANCHMQLGRYQTAITFLQESIEVGGLHASQCKNMAAVYQRLGQPEKALSWLRLACSVDPTKAGDPNVQAAISKLQDPANNPKGSVSSVDYLSSLTSHKGWIKKAMPLKVYVRKNIQIPAFYEEFARMIGESFDQWSAATDGAVSYLLLTNPEGANIICDYTDRKELVSSQHELGIDGTAEMLLKSDGEPGSANVVVLVKDSPSATAFRKRPMLMHCCLHEIGHALGMHGHSPNNHDVMFSAATLTGPTVLSERDKNTIRRIYKP